MHHPVGAFDDVASPVKILRLVALEPESFGQHPFRRHLSGNVAQNWIARGVDVRGFAERPLIHPKQRRPHWRAVLHAGKHRAGSAVQAYGGDALRRRSRLGQRQRNRLDGSLPPRFDLLLRPTWMGMVRLKWHYRGPGNPAEFVVDSRTQALRADINTQIERLDTRIGSHEGAYKQQSAVANLDSRARARV